MGFRIGENVDNPQLFPNRQALYVERSLFAELPARCKGREQYRAGLGSMNLSRGRRSRLAVSLARVAAKGGKTLMNSMNSYGPDPQIRGYVSPFADQADDIRKLRWRNKRRGTVLGLMAACLLTAQTLVRVQGQGLEVMTLPSAAETIVSTTAPTVFVNLMVAYGAIKVAEALSEPLENYEVGLRQWRGSESYSYDYPNGPYEPRGSERVLYYRYNPDTNTAFYQDVQRIWFVEGGNVHADQWVYYDAFGFSCDNMDVSSTWPASGQPGSYTETQRHTGYVDLYYCKRNGSAWFGRPVRVHVVGYTWTPWFNDIRELFRNWTGYYGHNQWLFVPKLSFAVFTPNRSVNSNLSYGYATTAYEIF